MARNRRNQGRGDQGRGNQGRGQGAKTSSCESCPRFLVFFLDACFVLDNRWVSITSVESRMQCGKAEVEVEDRSHVQIQDQDRYDFEQGNVACGMTDENG